MDAGWQLGKVAAAMGEGYVHPDDIKAYDYIVVGAGSAGAAVANRLSANPGNRVLLLEAGPASHPWSRIPIGYAKLINNPKANWLYAAEPEASTNGRKLPVPRGRLLGGSSAINGNAFVRGQASSAWKAMKPAATTHCAAGKAQSASRTRMRPTRSLLL
jgi:choline dehydrogenase-like flavoprotein